MPSVRFNGLSFHNVILDDALLEGACFSGCTLTGSTSFHKSVLLDVAFDEGAELDEVDFRNAELGGADFTECSLSRPSLLGVRFSKLTTIAPLLESPCREMVAPRPDWSSVMAVYWGLRKAAAERGDFVTADRCAYLAMTGKHREAIRAYRRLSPSGSWWVRRAWIDWLQPSLRAGFPGLRWMVHRGAWGYGFYPTRLILVMVTIVLCFAALYVWLPSGGQDSGLAGSIIWHDLVEGSSEQWCLLSERLVDALVLSFAAFLTLGFAVEVPNRITAVCVGIEAFAGFLLLNLFLVAWARKLIQGG